MNLCFAQINPLVGDIEGNTQKIISYLMEAKKKKADLVIFPEMVIVGYPPKDLILKRRLLQKNQEALEKIKKYCDTTAAVVGFVDQKEKNIFNSAALLYDKKIALIQSKTHLPNYDVFDEKRYFNAAKESEVMEVKGKKIGLTICEDIWKEGPVEKLKEKGAELIINISASPYSRGKEKIREKEILSVQTKKNKIPLAYCNLVGGQDDLIFDGHSYFFNEKGEKIFEAPSFQEGLFFFDTDGPVKLLPEKKEIELVFEALVLGIKDYFQKNGFQKAVIGLSGGIDSALTTVLAVEALGKENVVGITMPSQYSSLGSVEDSKKLAKNLSITFKKITLQNIFKAYLTTLAAEFKGQKENVAEENIQARIRGNILMAFSNKFGHIVLSTGNKSELAVGYCTLYGDMSGGLAVISDLPKTMVYEMANFYNQKKGKKIIPLNVIEKEPSAELRPNQKDSDLLPPYPILDQILELSIEKGFTAEEIIKIGFDPQMVEKVLRLVKVNEYKRYQAALGLRVTTKAFGPGRRMPITNGWGEYE